MKITSPFNFLGPKRVRDCLTEYDFVPTFSWMLKLYYNVVRPVVPLSLRRKLQKRHNKAVVYKNNFIESSFVELVQSSDRAVDLLRQLYPEHFSFALLLTHDVETEEGFNFIPRVIELEAKYGLTSSWNIVPYKYPIDQGIIKAITDAGDEIGIHGYNHDGKLYYSEKLFNERVPFINRAIREYNAVGFRSPMVHRNLVWLQKLDVQYDASCFDYDPYQPFPGGTGSIWPFIAGRFVELPYTMPQDHTLFYVLKEKNIDIWKKKADWIVKNHGMILTLTHPDYLKEKDHLALYEELLKYLSSLQGCWRCLPREMAQWWMKKHS